MAHRHHTFQRAQHRAGIARAEHVGEVLHWNTQRFYRGQDIAIVWQTTGVGDRLNR
ncbi:hypothetical protein D3C73_1568940 [compost metagenome]